MPQPAPPPIDSRQLKDILSGYKSAELPDMDKCYSSKPVSMETFDGNTLTFQTSALGRPHVIAISWFPNWKVRGASEIYRIAPGMMLIYPESTDVSIYYAQLMSDKIGVIFSVFGVIMLALICFNEVRRKHQHEKTVDT